MTVREKKGLEFRLNKVELLEAKVSLTFAFAYYVVW